MRTIVLPFLTGSLLLFSCLWTSAQELPTIIPPSPEAASLGKFSEVPISHYTGVPNISVPISSYRVGEKTFPVALGYHARGIRVDEIASRVGLGWALNAGGQITRQVRHKADDGLTGYTHVSNEHANVFVNGTVDLLTGLQTQFAETSDFDFDKLPDLFTLQGGGLSTKFIFSYADGNPLVQKYDDISVEHRMGASGIAGFIVTDQNGYKYYYGIDSSGFTNAPVADVDWTQKKYTLKANGNHDLVNPLTQEINSSEEWAYMPYYNTWHLTEVVSPNGDRANLIYNKETNYVYRRSSDKHNSGAIANEQLHNYTSLVRVEQHQLAEIRYNYDANGDYTKIVFEASDNRLDMYTTVYNDDGASSSDPWPSEAKELDAIKIYKQSHTYDDNGQTITDFTLNKSYNLSHHYMVSTDDTGPNFNYHTHLVTMNPSSNKRLVLDAITEVGQDGSTKPPYVFSYDATVLPNRHSNSQDYWGYYNGADNGQFMVGYGLDRRVDTTLSKAGMLKKITYPTGGSTRFSYEHNRGFKGSEYDDIWLPNYDGIDLPRINPAVQGGVGISSLIAYANGLYHSTGGLNTGYYASEAITVNTRSEFRLGSSFSLPMWDVDGLPVDQNQACIGIGGPYTDCKFRVRLVRVSGDPGEEVPVPGVDPIYFWTDSSQIWIDPGQYRLEVHPPSDWVADAQFGDPDFASFHVSLIWDDQVADEDTVLYAAGKRVQKIEYLDENDTVVSQKTYDYNNSGAILGIADFSYKVTVNLGGGPVETSLEPWHLYNTYQGNTIGYQLVDEYYGDKDSNHGKRSYQFLVPRDTGDFIANPLTPPTDNEWLRGLPRRIIDYKSDGNSSYTKVKQVDNEYLVANDDHINVLPSSFQTPEGVINPVIAPETQFYIFDGLDPEIDPTEEFPLFESDLPDIFYEKTRTNFRLPFVWAYNQSYIHHTDPQTGLMLRRSKIKIFHFTGGTLDTAKTTETLFDDNGLPTLVKHITSGYNYNNHYQPVSVTTVTSDGEPLIETLSYPQDLLGLLPTQAENDIVQDLIDQNRLVPLETRSYKDLNNDGLPGFGITDELLSTTKIQYDWFNGSTILEPKTIYTSKANDLVEVRINLESYNYQGNILQFTRSNSVSSCYIWGYNGTLPIAAIDNVTYTAISALPSFSGGFLLEGALSATQEAELRSLPNTVVTTYTYEEGVGLKTATDARGHDITYNYDTFNRLVSIVDEDGYLVSENDYNYELTTGIQNYIKNTTYLVETTDGSTHAITGNALTDDDKVESIRYFDGLGRGLQSIVKQAGGQRQDMVTSMGYDEFGRQLKTYLPYSRATSTMDFDSSLLPDANGNISALNAQYLAKYADDLTGVVNPYSENVVEASPLARVLEQAAPGSDWALGNGHTIRFEHLTNTYDANDPENPNNDNVIHFDVWHPTESGTLNTEKTELVYVAHYPADELYKTVTKDENWTSGKDHTTEEFTNKQGQLVLKRSFNNSEAHDTYYIYDDYGNLTYVLPPEASDDILVQDVMGRVAALVNYSWIELANVDKDFAEEYNRQLQDYENADILNADIQNAYGGQGGFTVTTLEDSDEVTLSINFSATDALELKTGELVSLSAYGNHSDTELGRITGQDYSYTFYITKNAIHISGSGELNGINAVFNSNTTLAYEQSYLWTSLLDIDSKFAAGHETTVLAHAEDTDQDPLNVYLQNDYGGRGGLNITIDEDDNMVLSFNISSTTALGLKQGVVANLNTKRRLDDRYLGRLSASGYSYDLELKDNSIVVTGTGEGVSFGTTLFPNPPDEDDPIIRTEVIEGLCYIYHYDYRNRPIEKKIPGKGWEHIVYDKLDRPILTQDARQRLNGEWLFSKYDVLGRTTYTGQYAYTPQGSTANAGRLELQSMADTQTTLYETKTVAAQSINGSTVHYTNNCFPNASDLYLLTINYYDDYNNTHLDTAELIKQSGDMVYDEAIDTNAKLLTTVSSVRVLDPSAGSGQADWITSVSYYDADDMPIYVASKNEYLNTTDVAITDYDFVGKIVTTQTTHTKDTRTPIVIVDNYTYDHAQRLLTQSQTINGGTPEQIVSNSYDEFGQLADKDVGGVMGGNGLQTVDYNYNIRGWLKSVNDGLANGTDLFGYRLNYNTTEQLGATALFNGNISEMYWTNMVADGSTQSQAYDYKYDALNRLTSANYHLLNSTDTNDYSLNHVAFDKNGNITELKRTGLVEAADGTVYFDIIDDLNYTYATYSNTLHMVHDNAVDKGFKDGPSTGSGTDTEDYLYDVNGSLKKDNNKGILDITYNHLNLPTVVTIDNGTTNGTIRYTYDATGVKLSKYIEEYPTATTRTTKTTDYAGAYIYEKTGGYSFDGQFWQGSEVDRGIKLIMSSEGYIQPDNTGNGYDYVYNLKDHLGNIRVTYLDKNQNNANAVDLEIVELNSYYPFGMTMEFQGGLISSYTNSVGSKFKYNHQEFEESMDLNITEMTFRQFDNALGRFMSIDPLAEIRPDWTPYRFGYNNPVFWNDPYGLIEESVLLDIYNRSGSGRTKWYNDNESRGFYTKDGGYVGYTSADAAFNMSPGEYEQLPGVRVNARYDSDNDSFHMTSKQKHFNDFVVDLILQTKWYKSAYFQTSGIAEDSAWRYVPVVGSGIDAYDAFARGDWLAGAGHTFLAITDVFLVKSVFTGIGKAVIKAGLKKGTKKYFGIGMSHNYGTSVSRWKDLGVNMTGQKHHWAISQKLMEQYPWLKPIGNQTWNLTRFNSHASHMRWAHGKAYPSLGLASIPGWRLLYPISSTPTWFKTGSIYAGKSIYKSSN